MKFTDLSEIEKTLSGNSSAGIVNQAKELNKIITGFDAEFDFKYPIRYAQMYEVVASTGQRFTPGASFTYNAYGNYFIYNLDTGEVRQLTESMSMFCGLTKIGTVSTTRAHFNVSGDDYFHTTVVTVSHDYSITEPSHLILLTDLDGRFDFSDVTYPTSASGQSPCYDLRYYYRPQWFTYDISTEQCVLDLGYVYFVLNDSLPSCTIHTNNHDTFIVSGEVNLI